MIPLSKPGFLWLSVTMLLLASNVGLIAAGYEAQALRGDLSPLPYYQTQAGREGKRFTDAYVNRYRIYDFYARQAEYDRSNPQTGSDLLPPFPELDGGRRGHWGGTNDRESGAYNRPKGPDFTRVTSRQGVGLFHLITGPESDPGVVVFNGLTDSFEGFYPKANLAAPQHQFGFPVDRFGFRLEVKGKTTLVGRGGDWWINGKREGRFLGYYISGNTAVFRSEVAGGQILERPQVVESSGLSSRLLSRDFEFVQAGKQAVHLRLPMLSETGNEAGLIWTVEAKGSAEWWVKAVLGERLVLHRVVVGGGLKAAPVMGGSEFLLSETPLRGRMRVISWYGETKDAVEAGKSLARLEISDSQGAPSGCVAGGPSRFPLTVKASGVLNADPACKGATYQMDDIPVPFDNNPYRTPMTISGIAFANEGTGYVTTLVGDVWKVSGLKGDLKEVVWKRYASGLDLPMGIVVVDGVPYVNARRFIFRLVDLNRDGEADYYERFSREEIPYVDESGHDLQRDEAGNFYLNSRSGIFCVGPDGGGLKKVGEGSRNPLGLGVRGDGLALSDSSEGESQNGTCSIYESNHPENQASRSKRRRLIYLPRGVDNSPGSRLFLKEPRFGPLGDSLVGLSYGTGSWYYLVRDLAEGTPQAALVPMPGQFASGSCRVAVQPQDGQLFVAGLDGWGDYATSEGCLHRVRWVGQQTLVLKSWKACRNGILLGFNQDPGNEALKPEQWFAQQWNYLDSTRTYGSPEYSVKTPGKIGHDRLNVQAVSRVSEREIFLQIPDLLPSMCLQLHGRLQPSTFDSYFTLNRLLTDHPAAPAVSGEKPVVLKVPEQESNGDTYQNVVTFFDQLYGRAIANRPEGSAVKFQPEELSYAWLKKNLIEVQCMPCHGAGTQHDFTSYEGLMRKVDLKQPEKSPLIGMLETSSMPPYPLPKVHGSAIEALRLWIRKGAPKS